MTAASDCALASRTMERGEVALPDKLVDIEDLPGFSPRGEVVLDGEDLLDGSLTSESETTASFAFARPKTDLAEPGPGL